MRKQAKSVSEMIELLKQRGLTVDVPDMSTILLDNNYYRLSAYFRPFQNDPANGDNSFCPGTKASDFLTPFTMDDQFRHLILEGTSRLELTLRARFAYNLAQNDNAYTYDEPMSYRDIAYPDGTLKRDSLISNIKGWVPRSHKCAFGTTGISMRSHRFGPWLRYCRSTRCPRCFSCTWTRMPCPGRCCRLAYARTAAELRKSCMRWSTCVTSARIIRDCGTVKW